MKSATIARAALLSAAFFACSPLATLGGDYGYTVASGNWTAGGNWTNGSITGTVPGDNNTNDRAFIGGAWLSGMAATSDVTLNTAVPFTMSQVYVGGVNPAGGSGTWTVQSLASLTAGSNLYIGAGDPGTVTQSGGSLSFGETWVGGGGNGGGTYTLSGTGSLSNAGRLIVGIGSTSSFTQSGGTTVSNAGGTYIGWETGKTGTYSLSGGTLNSSGGEFWLANGGVGILNVSGTGVLNHTAGRFIVGTFATGTVNQSGGTVNSAGSGLYFGQGYSGGTGQYNLSGGTLNVAELRLTPTAEGSGAMQLTGGVFNATNVYGNITNNGSTIAAGGVDVVGTTTMNSWYHAPVFTQTSGTLAIDLATGATNDLISITGGGTASLGGLLDVNLVGAYTPLFSDTFTILTASSVSGAFSNASVSGNRYTVGEGSFIVTYNPTSVVLSGFQAVVVPEPSSLIMFLLGSIGLWRVRRSRKRQIHV